MKIGFVRRGFSSSGGAENYLQRLARGVREAGHDVELFTTKEWPAEEWTVGTIESVTRRVASRVRKRSRECLARDQMRCAHEFGASLALQYLSRGRRRASRMAGAAGLIARAAAAIHDAAQPETFGNLAVGRSPVPETRRRSSNREFADGQK